MASDTAAASAPGTQGIVRTLAVLTAFREADGDLGIADLAHRLSLSASTVHRIVRALVAEGYLAQNTETERYHLGRGAVLLGQAANRRLGLHLAQPVLQRLAEETGESVNLGVRDDGEMVVVLRVESKQPLRFSQEPGSRLPVYASAMGKATLSRSEPLDEDLATLPDPAQPLTANTIVAPGELRREVERTRDRGFSMDDEEAILGVRCVAAPIVSATGELLAALGIQGPAVRMSPDRLRDLGPRAISAAEEISHLLPDGQLP